MRQPPPGQQSLPGWERARLAISRLYSPCTPFVGDRPPLQHQETGRTQVIPANRMAKPTPSQLVRIEAQALASLADRLEGEMAPAFARAVDLVAGCGEARGRVVVTGMGKSGIIAQKIAATLNSTGTPSLFLHPAEALHGDLGMLARGDVVLALSSSGETEEIVRLLPTLKRIGDALICFCSVSDSTLALASDVALDTSVEREACALGLAPTASTTAMLALGDALAIAVSLKNGFQPENFADLHPAGNLGKKLARVRELMHRGEAIPKVERATKMTAVIYEMSRKGLGMTIVADGDRLAGIISDGDLRRLLERKGPDALVLSAEAAMNPSPKTIRADELGARALTSMEEHKITALVVVDDQGAIAGVLHLHDLWGLEPI
jgi:arabinose-5-phosphate isomerase